MILTGGVLGMTRPHFQRLPTWELDLGAGDAWRRLDVPTVHVSIPSNSAHDPWRRELWMFSYHEAPMALRIGLAPEGGWAWIPIDEVGYDFWLQAVAVDRPRNRVLMLGNPNAYVSRDTLALYSAPIDDTLRFTRLAVPGPHPVRWRTGASIAWDAARSAFRVATMNPTDRRLHEVWTLFTGEDRHWDVTEPLPDAGTVRPSGDGVSSVLDPLTSDLYLTSIERDPPDYVTRLTMWRLEWKPVPRWTRLEAPPELGTAGTFVIDSRRRRLIHHGGYDRSFRSLEVTHFLDLGTGTWSRPERAVAPEPRTRYAIAYDRPRDRVLMFGGIEQGRLGPMADLWARSSRDGTWERLEPSGTPPSPRADAVLVEDPRRSRFLLVGGWTGSRAPAEIWQLESAESLAWSQLATEGAPPDEVDGAFLDVDRDRLLVHGSLAVADAREPGEWELKLASAPRWRRLPVAGGAQPPSLCGFTLDRARNRALLFGGYPGGTMEYNVAWSFSLEADTVRWMKVSEADYAFVDRLHPYVNRGGLLVDPVRDRMISVGGGGWSMALTWIGSDVASALSLSGDPVWAQYIPGFGGPPRTRDRPIVFDPVRDSFLFCGAGEEYGSTSVFEWEGGFEGWPEVMAHASITPDPSVLLEWSAPATHDRLPVLRRIGDEAWTEIGTAVRGGDGILRFTDATVEARTHARYRLTWTLPGGEIPVGEIAVRTEAPAIAAVRLRRNPTQGSIAIDLDLPRAGPVQVRLLDVAGRLVREERFTASGAGRRFFQLGSLEASHPGLYFLQVESPAGTASARVTLLR